MMGCCGGQSKLHDVMRGGTSPGDVRQLYSCSCLALLEAVLWERAHLWDRTGLLTGVLLVLWVPFLYCNMDNLSGKGVKIPRQFV
jgi:hypothetical protein